MTGPGPAEQKPTRAARGSASKAAPTTDPDAAGVADAAVPPEVAPPKAKATRKTDRTEVVTEVTEVAAVSTPGEVPPSAATVPDPATAPAPPVVDAAAPDVAPAAAPDAPAPAASGIERPADTGPGAPGAIAAVPAARSTPDVAAAVDKAFGRLREHLTVGEIVAGLGAAIILVVAWATFGFLFGHGGTWPSQLVLLLSVALLAILVVQNAKIHDFGPNYRLLVTGACLALGFLAAVSILSMIRGLVDGARLDIGGLTWWAGAIVAVLGGWMVWREPR